MSDAHDPADCPKPDPVRVAAQWQARRGELRGGRKALPPPDADLAVLARTTLPATPAQAAPSGRGGHVRKDGELARAFAGRSKLAHLNALVVAHLRKRSWPDRAPLLFQRIWAEHHDTLIAELDSRWLVSSVATFGDHGVTAAQRSAGLALAVLFNTMKLYEAERLYTGVAAHKAHTIKGRADSALPMAMAGYSLHSGGLDTNLLARLWDEAAQDAVLAPLGHHLLASVMEEERGLFHRLRIMRMRKARAALKSAVRTHEPPLDAGPGPSAEAAPPPLAADDPPAGAVPAARLVGADHIRAHAPGTADTPKALRWGVAVLLPGPAEAALDFVGHHLGLGAHALFVATADTALAERLQALEGVRVTRLTPAEAAGAADSHAARAYAEAGSDLHWLAHLAPEDRLLAHRPVAETLCLVPPEAAFAELQPVEALHRHGAARHFRRRAEDVGGLGRVGADSPADGDGFAGTARPGGFARTGLPAPTVPQRHALQHQARLVVNTACAAGLLVGRLVDGGPPDTPAVRARLAARGLLVGRNAAVRAPAAGDPPRDGAVAGTDGHPRSGHGA